ncbi:MAG: hypothetical protein ACYDBQ_04305 [Thermoplasmatota archaeon]
MAEYAYLRFPAESVHVDPVRYGALPESARRVFEALRERGPLTHNELREATTLPARTIRFAVKRLKDNQLIASLSSLRDCRKCYFYVDKRCVGDEALEAARSAAQEAVRQGRFVEWVGTPSVAGDVRPAPPRPMPIVDFARPRKPLEIESEATAPETPQT